MTVTVAPAPVTIDAQVTPSSATAGGTVHVHATVAAGRARVGNAERNRGCRSDTSTGAHLADLTLDSTGAVDGDVPIRPAVGGHTLTLTYTGDTDFTGGTASASYGVVATATTTITSVDMANLSFGQTVTLPPSSPKDTRTPTGTVQFSDGANTRRHGGARRAPEPRRSQQVRSPPARTRIVSELWR